MNSQFRFDIQGLRAISVLVVFLFHAGISGFSGGFVGVDVFFVISGYVITGLLLNQYAKGNNKIDLLRFYSKRIMRLMPALFFLIAVGLLLSTLILTPTEQLGQYDAARFTLISLSNIYFLTFNLDYFSPAIHENLFLHTWSLGVEEQFYLIWPLVLLWLLKTKGSKSNFIYKAGIVVFCSAVLQFYVEKSSHTTAFYLMPSRAWQFTIGSIIAYIHSNPHANSRIRDNDNEVQIGSVIGFLLIIYSVLVFNEGMPYPSWRAILPTLGTGLILFYFNPLNSTILSRLLSIKPLVWLGNISYSFYLWHWVVLLLFKKLIPFFPQLNTLIAFLVIVILSAFSYYLIENPLRKSKTAIIRPKLVLIGTFFLVFVLWQSINILEKCSNIKSDESLSKVAEIRTDLPELYQYDCDDWYHSSELNPCSFGDRLSRKKLVVFGDSVLAQWFPLIQTVHSLDNWQIIVLTKSACPLVDVPFYYAKIKREYKECEMWREAAIKYIQELKPEKIIMGSASFYPYSKKEWQDGTNSVLKELESSAEIIKLIAATPQLNFDSVDCMARVAWMNSTIPWANEGLCHQVMNVAPSWEYLEQVSEQFEAVEYLNFKDYICPSGICPALINGLSTYRDEKHLTTTFINSLAEKLKDKL